MQSGKVLINHKKNKMQPVQAWEEITVTLVLGWIYRNSTDFDCWLKIFSDANPFLKPYFNVEAAYKSPTFQKLQLQYHQEM